MPLKGTVLPYQELLGNYNSKVVRLQTLLSFTIPRTARELQLRLRSPHHGVGFTIPRTARELQQVVDTSRSEAGFTIPRTARELQLDRKGVIDLESFTIPRTARELQPKDRTRSHDSAFYHTKNC